MKEFLTAVQGYVFFLQWSETDPRRSAGTCSMKPLICHAPGEGEGGEVSLWMYLGSEVTGQG